MMDRQLNGNSTSTAISTFDQGVNTGLCLVFEISNPETLAHLQSIVAKTKFSNFAEVLTIYDVTQSVLPENKKPLFDRLLKTPFHLATYCFLASHHIKAPSHDVAVKTMRLARIVLQNPYKLLGSDYDEYLEYGNFTYDMLHQIALKLLGVQVMQDSNLMEARATAGIMQILADEESQKGNTWTSWRQIKQLLCQLLKQSLSMVEQIVPVGTEAFDRIVGIFVVDNNNNNNSKEVDEGQIRLQRPDTKAQEDMMLAYIGYMRHRSRSKPKEYPVNEELLEQTLHEVVGSNCTRDAHQLAAIRLAISSPVSCITGPPGAGKTTLVVRVIVRYVEQQNENLLKQYKMQHAARCMKDEEQIEKELQQYTLKLNREFRIIGNLHEEGDEDKAEGTEMQARFDDMWDEVKSIQPNHKLSKHRTQMHIKNIRYMVSQKRFELRYEKYRRASSSTDLNMVKLIAPSGVAARRLCDACDGHQTHTCCSLISQLREDQLKEDEHYHDFYPFKMLIVDEASMIDLEMIISIINSVEQAKCQLVFVGDHHQLPPIGKGQFFRDVIQQQLLPCVALQTIYRQGSGSKIAELSKSIVAGTANDFLSTISPTMSTTTTASATASGTCPNVVEESTDIIKVYMPDSSKLTTGADWAPPVAAMYRSMSAHYNYDVNAVRVLTPYKEGNCGRYSVNQAIQSEMLALKIRLNHGADINRPHKRFVSYDPVIHKKNNKKLDVCNGDLGVVMPSTSAEEKTVNVKFPHQTLTYASTVKRGEQIAELKHLELAFALTGHAAQGSQCPCVIVVLARFVARFTTNLMLNTLISRASKKLIIVTQEEILDRILREEYEERQTRINLTDFLYFLDHNIKPHSAS